MQKVAAPSLKPGNPCLPWRSQGHSHAPHNNHSTCSRWFLPLKNALPELSPLLNFLGPGRACLLSEPLIEGVGLVSTELSQEMATFQQAVLAELILLNTRKSLAQTLEGKSKEVVADCLASFQLFLGSGQPIPSELGPALESVLLLWCQQMSQGEEEARFQLACAWVAQVTSCFSAPQQEWRYLLACLEQAFYRQLGPEQGRQLHESWESLANATSRFELCSALLRRFSDLRQALGNWPFEVEELLVAALAECLLEAAAPPTCWPLSASVFQFDQAFGAIEAAQFSEFRQRLSGLCRDRMERNWLDLLLRPLERVQACLDHQQWRMNQRTGLQAYCAASAASLREALEAFRKNPAAESDLFMLLEACSCYRLVGSSIKASQAALRHWLGSCYGLFPASSWAQPKTVLAALGTHLQNQPEEVRRPLEAIQSLLQFCESSLNEIRSSLKVEMDWAKSDLDRQIWLSWVQNGAFAGRHLTSLPALTPSGLEDWILRCPLEEAQNSLRSALPGLRQSALGQRLWSKAETIAEASSQYTYQHLSEYAQATQGAAGQAKCARDNAFTLRRVALAWSRQVDDPASFVSDWWNGVVNAYLVNRPKELFLTNLEGLLEASRDHLDVDDQSSLEAVLRPIYEEAAGGRPAHTPVPWSHPGAGRLPAFSELKFTEAQLQSAQAYAQVEWKGSDKDQWVHILQQGWCSYLWQGFLDPLSCKYWRSFPIQDKLERLMVGLMLAPPENASHREQLLRLDYFQAVVQFARQLQVGPQWKRQAALLVQDLPDPQLRPLLADCLQEAGEHMQKLGFPFWCWEADRRWLELMAGRTPIPITQLLEHLLPQLDQLSGRLLQQWMQFYLGGEERISAYSALSALYSQSENPLFSPNPLEEEQWRQTLSLLLVSCCRPQGPETQQVFFSLGSSLKIFQDRQFPEKLARVRQLLAKQSGLLQTTLDSRFEALREAVKWAQEVEGVARNLSHLSNSLGAAWSTPDQQSWLLHLCRDAYYAGQSSSHWMTTSAQRMSPTSQADWPQQDHWKSQWKRIAPSLSESLQAGILVEFGWQSLGQAPNTCARDIAWLRRREEVGGNILLWYAHEVYPYVGDTPPSESWKTLKKSASVSFLCSCLQAFQGNSPARDLLLGNTWEPWLSPAQPEEPRATWLSLAQLQECNQSCGEQISTAALESLLALLERDLKSGWKGASAQDCQQLLEACPAATWNGLLQGILGHLQTQKASLNNLAQIDSLQALQDLFYQVELGMELSRPTSTPQIRQWGEILALSGPHEMLINSALFWSHNGSPWLTSGEHWSSLWDRQLLEVEGKLSAVSARLWQWLCKQMKAMGNGLVYLHPLLNRLHLPQSPLHFPEALPASQRHALVTLLLTQAVAEVNSEQANGIRRRLALRSLPWPKLCQDLLAFLGDEFLDVDLSSVQRHFAQFVQLYQNHQSASKAERELPHLAQSLSQKIDTLQALTTNDIEIVLAHLLHHSTLHGSQSSWHLPPFLLHLPEPIVTVLANLPSNEQERLKAALTNVLAKVGQPADEALRELGRCLEIAQRLPELQHSWNRADELNVPGSQNQSFWRWLVRRVAVEGWLAGRPYSGQGSLAWLKTCSLGWLSSELPPRQFLKANKDALASARNQKILNDSMTRVAEEYCRALERRLDVNSGSIWELLQRPVLDSEAAQKPQKRSIWGRLTESFEGLVGGR